MGRYRRDREMSAICGPPPWDMLSVEIPFNNQFEEAMVNDVKTKTSRNKIYGKVGMVFWAFKHIFLITAIEPYSLTQVATKFYKEEGLESPEAFRKIWEDLHPRKGWIPDQVVWVHSFKRVTWSEKDRLGQS
jgi:hypothetical protein